MSENSLLARWLEPEGGQMVGRQLEAKLNEMATSADPELQVKLDPEVLEAAQLAVQKAAVFESLNEQELSMTQIDRGTDRNASGYYNALLERERCFDHDEFLPLTPSQQKQLQTLRSARVTLFPEGTTFLQSPYHIQLAHLGAIHKKLTQNPQLQTDLQTLGLQEETARFLAWIARYEARQTQGSPPPSQKVSEALYAFHSAWEDFTIEARQKRKKTQDPKLIKAYATLLALYDQQAQKERDIEKRHKAPSKDPG
jgi:hypothetical protein